MFSTDFIFRQQENPEISGWIQATMQQNTIIYLETLKLNLPYFRVCKWADQVDACKKMMNEEEKAQDFTCPKTFTRGIYSKHAHPQDCRQCTCSSHLFTNP